MKNKVIIFYLLIASCIMKAQIMELPLVKAGVTKFTGKTFIYGFSLGKSSKFMLYAVDGELKLKDSMSVDIGFSPEQYLNLSSDTLHDFLNIYLQRKEKKLVQILRFDKTMKLLANIENVDIARLNSIAAFESEIIYDKKDVYTIKSVAGDSGKQFFLNKYSLKSEDKNFEYEQNWQFAFERKNINSAHIIKVFKGFVLMYVNVYDGPKRGQWLLRVNSENGKLIRGTKLAYKGDPSFYTLGGILHDTTSGWMYAVGQKFSPEEFNQKENKFNIAGKPVTLYLTQLDSAGELVEKNDFKIPLAEPKGNKTANSYLIRVTEFIKDKEGNLKMNADIFKGNQANCFLYCNSLAYNFVKEGSYTLKKSAVATNTAIERFYFSKDPLDRNGKLCSDSLIEFEKMYYKSIPFTVKLANKEDDLGNQVILLKKSDGKKQTDIYSLLSTVNQNLLLTRIDEISKSEEPCFILLSTKQYIICRQSSAERFQIRLTQW